MIRFFSQFRALPMLYAAIFFFGLHIFVPVYVNSSFLNQFLPEEILGYAYSVGAIFTIIALFYIPKVLRQFGNYKLTILIGLVSALAVLGLVFVESAVLAVILLLLFMTTRTLLIFVLDIFVERNTPEQDTGEIRGVLLSIAATTILMSTLLISVLLTDIDFWKIYLFSAVIIFPALFILFARFQSFEDREYDDFKVFESIKCILVDRNLHFTFMAHMILRIFFTWMVIYAPIYLHQYVGLTWTEIGIILAIGILPYILLEIPLGRAADDIMGEKELLTIGFFINGNFHCTYSICCYNKSITVGGTLFCGPCWREFCRSYDRDALL